jgi:hypothetical protein
MKPNDIIGFDINGKYEEARVVHVTPKDITVVFNSEPNCFTKIEWVDE